MKISYYNSGNISDASIDGNRISNSAARRILGGQYFVDTKTGIINTEKTSEDYRETITKYMAKQVGLSRKKRKNN